MDEFVEEELDRLSDPVEANDSGVIDSSVLNRPLARLFSKRAITVDVNQTVGEALEQMRSRGFGAVCVTERGVLAGILTERDLVMRVFGVLDAPLTRKVGEVMTASPITLQASDDILYACHNLHVGGCRHLPVVDAQGRPESVVSIKDVFRYLLGYFQDEVTNVTGEPYRGPQVREGA
jgi:CBS domain-containing protein